MNSRRSRTITAAFGAFVFASSLLVTGAGTVAAETPNSNISLQPISFPTDTRFTQLLGINDRNVIAGYHGDENTEQTPNKGFTLELPDKFTDENFPNSMQTQVVGINNRGETVGFYVDQAGNTHGFQKKDTDFTTVDLPGTTFNQLLGVNDKGQASGYFQDAAGLQHAYVHETNGEFRVLNIPMPSSQATGINRDGTVVGFEQSSPAATTASGWMLKDGKLNVINFPGSTFTEALGVNDRGAVVGVYNDANGVAHGFGYQDGNFASVDGPGAVATTINGINNNNRAVGFFTDANGNTIGLVATPRRS
jgi:probable HAF family extracellular repeat protein